MKLAGPGHLIIAVSLGLLLTLGACKRTGPEGELIKPEATEREVAHEGEPRVQGPVWIDLPPAQSDLLGIRKLMEAFSETSRCFSHEERHFLCLGTRHYERKNSRGEILPYSQDVPGFLVGDGQTLYYVMVERMGIDGATRRLTFAEPDSGWGSGPALILEEEEEIPKRATVVCGEESVLFETLSRDESKELLTRAVIKTPPPSTEISGGRLEDGSLVVLWTGSMPGLPQQRILAVGTPPTLDRLEIVATRPPPTPNSRLFDLPDGGSLLIAPDDSQPSRFQRTRQRAEQDLTHLSDEQWDPIFATLDEPGFVRHAPAPVRGACAVLKLP